MEEVCITIDMLNPVLDNKYTAAVDNQFKPEQQRIRKITKKESKQQTE